MRQTDRFTQIHRDRHRYTDRQTGRHTDRYRDKQTECEGVESQKPATKNLNPQRLKKMK